MKKEEEKNIALTFFRMKFQERTSFTLTTKNPTSLLPIVSQIHCSLCHLVQEFPDLLPLLPQTVGHVALFSLGGGWVSRVLLVKGQAELIDVVG